MRVQPCCNIPQLLKFIIFRMLLNSDYEVKDVSSERINVFRLAQNMIERT